MYEILAHPITLLCLGVIFILIALLFFYFKRTFSLLERAQMEQARVLQSFISNMEMSNLRNRQIPHLSGDSFVHPPENLINVSDDENSQSDDDSNEESDDEDSDEESETTNSIIDIEATEELEDSNKEIKVIQLENSNLEEVNDLEIQELNNSDDDDDDDDDDDEEEDDDEDNSNSHEEQDNESSTISLEPVTLDKVETVEVSYRNMNVNALKSIAKEKGLMTDGDKKTKKELIKLLEGEK